MTFLLYSQSNLTYQSRGHYREGTRAYPSTGESLDLVSAMVDYREPYTALPLKFQALFYLPRQEPVFVTIREIQPSYYYWLDKVQPESGWHAGRQNPFEWSTGTVISALNWKKGAPLKLDDLGATARLGNESPGMAEKVAPVVLFHSKPPQSVEGYCFVFRPSGRMRLGFQIFTEGKPAPLVNQSFPSVLAGEPHKVKWSAKGWQQGWYILTVDGFVVSNNDKVSSTVRFYHVPRLGN